jgi:hypothetical protein
MQLMPWTACDGQVPAVLYDLFIQSWATGLLNIVRATTDYDYVMCWLKCGIKSKSAAD